MNAIARFVVLILLALPVACARQPQPPGVSDENGSGSVDERKLPFDQRADSRGIAPTSSLVPTPQDLPAGTPVTVRLRSSISSGTAHPGDPFQAVLDDPIILQGRTVLPTGTPITGEVVGVNRSATAHAPAYLRLTLISLSLNGKDVALQSSSLFTKAGLQPREQDRTGSENFANTNHFSAGGRGRMVEFGSDHRLTFRLTAPVILPR